MDAASQDKEMDAALIEFLSQLGEYTPAIPDELAEHYLTRSGFNCPDIRVTRLVSVAAQKFISEIASDARQYCKLRQSGPGKDKKAQPGKEKRLVLTSEDLAAALAEYGVNLKRRDAFADAPVPAPGTATKEKFAE